MRSRRVKKKIARPRKARATKKRSTKKARAAKRPRATSAFAKQKQRAAKKRPPAKRAPSIDRGVVTEVERGMRRLRAARRRLEERLTAAVQEIGTLRQYERRAQMLESELAAKDAEIARLREQATERLGGASIVSAPAGASN
jgi:hypothetical protein